ncbi:pilus assembly protein [Jiella sp. MQZ9-1]|uniref:Pilus assembly protein n=1 Tax=Jiella flava TaxID=2816857 RepID=A0A939JVV7_9HYPH|nr:TadE/TadG family type IV pilus assembly protein [Jiella flava]MBO0662392.1 pilus assembly protein [Jiella flava]MCD2471616.1 pilus assembly protein [Jiella flava]
MARLCETVLFAVESAAARLLCLARDRRGAAAVEFALVVPFIALLYMAGSDTTIALSINRKIHNAASTIGDLVGQVTAVTPSELNGLLNVTASLMQPYDASKIFLRVTQVKIDANGKATVDWTRSRNTLVGTTELHAGDVYTLPSAFAGRTSTYFIVAEAYYSYETFSGFGLVGPIVMGETSYITPRLSDHVTCSGC